ncbi:MAG: pyruvate ferredoxin oxidoreductase, partial [Candidatus Diapherotrites archaeon]|nr:pyruvate ferredoxin oxidoreductase [Candidatus Diapherotrites archaeon]
MSFQRNRTAKRRKIITNGRDFLKTILNGSQAVAEAVKLCQPTVLPMYPITPSTHIPEALTQMKADGELNGTPITVESEFSALSACIGASATGVRTFTATSSQGLALMHELLHVTSGMRLPVVMTVANRALSAPINIWNDWQDSISARDSGWIQLYCESNQEALDTMIQAYKIAEDPRVLLPVMVCMDGFYLTHATEPVDMPTAEEVKSFLPEYKPEHAYLDPERP